MLRTGQITRQDGPAGCLRISVMSRHTLNDGRTPHPDINDDSFDVWWPSLAPPDRLIGSYYKRGLPWQTFADKYLDYLNSADSRHDLGKLVELAGVMDVTVLCIEDGPERCHRRLLAEACRQLVPDLKIHIA